MPRVVLPRSLGDHTGGLLEVEVEGADVRAVIEALETRFPGIAGVLEGGMAVAIDGEIVGDPLLESVEPDGEVHFLPRVGGG